MSDIVRDSVLGQIIRQLSGRRYFLYPEERPGFKCPAAYHDISPAEREKLEHMALFDAGDNSPEPVPSSQQTTQGDLEGSRSPVSPNGTLSNDATRTNNPEDLQREVSRQLNLDLTRTKSVPIMPTVTASGDILVDWYDSDDPENPQNWSDGKRAWVVIVLCAYTFVVYTASAIYTTGIYDIRQEWDLRAVDASLPLALYVLAYGIGPLLFSPLSEIPYFGRLPVYAATMVIFVLLSIPTPIVGNFAGLLVLRFLQGFFGSPCLATGGASMQDMYSLIKVPYALTAWVAAAYCGPALGPLISGFAVMRNGWRWSLWPILWASGFVLIFMITLFPETSGPTILYRRARRLRAITGNPKIKSKTEIERGTTSATDIFVDAVIKPFEITIKDPAIAFVNLYTALIYGIYYSFFEAFPIVYGEYYGFSIGIIGVIFTCVLVSCLIGIAVYVAYQYFYLIPDIEKNGFREQEHRLVPALFGCFGPPIGLFIFAWTGRSDIHWIVPTIGITIFGATVFVVMQCIFVYVPFTYPRYAASLFAANDFLRSAMACGSILYATPMFDHLGIGRGTSLLGGLSVMGIIGMFALYHYGAYLRGRSKFTTPPE